MQRITRDVSKWNIYQHRSARDLHMVDKDDTRERQLEDEFFDRLYAGPSEELKALQPTPHVAWARRLHEQCEKLPAFSRLAQECAGDADASATAVETLMTGLAPYMNAELESERAKAEGRKSTHAIKPPDDAMIRKVVGRGVVKAEQAIVEQREAAESMSQVALGAGMGSQQGSAMEQSSPRKVAERLRTDHRLKKIAELAGRFTRIAARKQRMKVKHGRDEVTDVEMGSDIARLLPVELAAFTHPLRKLALMRDLIENRALQYRMEGTDQLGKGPLVVCLDKSGSMSGNADVWATAVALALMWIAQKQRRTFALLGFDGRVKSEHVVKAGDPLPEDALFTGCNGGTDIANCYGRGLDIIQGNPGVLRKADVVIITDGDSDGSRAAQLRERAKSLGVTTLGFGIGVDKAALATWCDEAGAIHNLHDVDDTTAEKLFTI